MTNILRLGFRRRIIRWISGIVREAFNLEMSRAEMKGYKRGHEHGYETGLDRGFDKAVMHQIRTVGSVERGASERFAAQIRGIG